jgi:hypothetical protein
MNACKQFIIEQIPGYAVVNMNYRLADGNNTPYPMQINDTTSVIDDLGRNKNEYAISDNVSFVGVSAGTHVSLLWSYVFDTENQTDTVCTVIGPTNFTDPVLQDIVDAFGINPSVPFLETLVLIAALLRPRLLLFYFMKLKIH